MDIHATKLQQPRPRANWIVRERLLTLLNRGLEEGHHLMLVSAPAGAGKTTLLAHWLAARPSRAAWLSLDPEDDDPARFWSCVIQALQSVVPGLGEWALAALASQPPPPLASLLPGLLNEIGRLKEPLILVLDDCHVLAARGIHESITSVVDHLPEPLHLVICTRADPPLPLARWRAGDALTEVRAADLRFTPAEALAFLNQRMDLHLQVGDAERLVERTEGWAVGLQLAALSLQGQSDPAQAIQALAGGQHFVLEYLLEEVLARQPEAIQRFLLHTAILDRMCGPLCDAVVMVNVEGSTLDEDGSARPESSGSSIQRSAFSLQHPQKQSQMVLQQLERSNLFVVPLDPQRTWYRYHHLFADLLRARLQLIAPHQVEALHLRASKWYEANGSVAEAVRHALAAHDWERAASLLKAHQRDWWAGSDASIISLISQLPEVVILRSPSLAVFKAWFLLISGQTQRGAKVLVGIERMLSEGDLGEDTRGLLGFVSVQQAYIAELSGSPRPQDVDATCLAHMPENFGGLRNSAEVALAFVLYRNADFAAAAPLLQATIARDTRIGGTSGIPVGAGRLARMWIVEGRLQEAAELCRSCLSVVDERGRWRFYIVGYLSIILGDVLREWNRLDEAEACVHTGIQDDEPWGIPHSHAIGYTALARVLLGRGDVPGAAAALAREKELTGGRTILPDLVSETRAAQVCVWLASGDMESVARWAAEWAPRAEAVPDFRNEQDLLTLARAWVALGQACQAAELLARMQESAARGGRLRRSAEILALLALALQALGQGQRANEAIEQSLALAAPMGCVRLFLDEGQEMIALVAAARERNPLSPGVREFARCILASSSGQRQEVSPRPGFPAAARLVEPLTPREQEVLALLAAGCSNQDIAERLVITIAAVKKHAGSIYGKLAVTSRTQAVARARQLGLLGDRTTTI